MKSFYHLLSVIAIFAVCALYSCGGHSDAGPRSYDSAVCEQLAMKVERRYRLTQHDYAVMMHKN